MDARLLRSGLLLVLFWLWGATPLLGANYGSVVPQVLGGRGATVESQHFQVTAPTAAFARQVCEAAEYFRRTLAIDWLGSELPEWQERCPIHVIVGTHIGAGGATTFTFINNQPRHWRMEIQGSQQRLLDSVLPHEITHTVFATHFGCPLPRWADEGAATSVEHASERNKQNQLLIQFLTSNRGIAFNEMFAMRDYPPDILPLYSQGYSLARYLIAQGGRRKYVDYVYDGMRWNNWTAATEKHYGMHSLSELQVSWLDWVRRGSRDIRAPLREGAADNRMLADAAGTNSAEPAPPPPPPADALADTESASRLVPLPPRPAASGSNVPVTGTIMIADRTAQSHAAGESWYTQQRDRTIGPITAPTTDLRPATTPAAERTALDRGTRILR